MGQFGIEGLSERANLIFPRHPVNTDADRYDLILARRNRKLDAANGTIRNGSGDAVSWRNRCPHAFTTDNVSHFEGAWRHYRR